MAQIAHSLRAEGVARLVVVTDELDTRGVPYQLEGSRLLVPQPQLHEVRAQLAQAGRGPDADGYRAELVRLVKLAEGLTPAAKTVGLR